LKRTTSAVWVDGSFVTKLMSSRNTSDFTKLQKWKNGEQD
jgi:hypothetical protein